MTNEDILKSNGNKCNFTSNNSHLIFLIKTIPITFLESFFFSQQKDTSYAVVDSNDGDVPQLSYRPCYHSNGY